MSEKAYETIMNLRGYEEFKALAKRLCQLAQRGRELSGVRAPLPNFLFVEAPGAGVTTQLKLLTRLLMEQKLMRFAGERRFSSGRWTGTPSRRAAPLTSCCRRRWRWRGSIVSSAG